MTLDRIIAAFSNEPYGERFAEAARLFADHVERPRLFEESANVNKLAMPVMLFLFEKGLHKNIPAEVFVDELVVFMHNVVLNGKVLGDGTVVVNTDGLNMMGHDIRDESAVMASLAKLFSEGLNTLYGKAA